MRALTLFTALVASSFLFANEPAATAPQLTGEKLVEAKGCVACHGKDGNGAITATGSIDPQYPILAGQYASYLEFTMKAYRSGARNNDVMKGFSQGLTDADIKELSRHFSTQSSKLGDLSNID